MEQFEAKKQRWVIADLMVPSQDSCVQFMVLYSAQSLFYSVLCISHVLANKIANQTNSHFKFSSCYTLNRTNGDPDVNDNYKILMG